jgi:hypothetical protein
MSAKVISIGPVANPPPSPKFSVISKVMATAWDEIAKTNIPAETYPDLVKTYKRFFYCGARAVMHDLVYSDALDEGMAPTQNDLQKVDAILHELNEFFCEVVAGRQ